MTVSPTARQGAGTVVGFERATIGVSEHLLRLDATDTCIRLKLERKTNGQTKWMLAPPEVRPNAPDSGVAGPAATQPVPIAAPGRRARAGVTSDRGRGGGKEMISPVSSTYMPFLWLRCVGGSHRSNQ